MQTTGLIATTRKSQHKINNKAMIYVTRDLRYYPPVIRVWVNEERPPVDYNPQTITPKAKTKKKGAAVEYHENKLPEENGGASPYRKTQIKIKWWFIVFWVVAVLLAGIALVVS
jgi:hypothetical protein